MENLKKGLNQPDLRNVRSNLEAVKGEKSTLFALILFFGNIVLYIFTFWGILFSPWWPVKILCSISNGLIIGTLFVLGHDCCHGSFTKSKLINKIIGRLSFLPSLTPFTSWELQHNRVHHLWTNLRGKDFVWTPLSKQEFDKLNPFRKIVERIYRSFFGVTLYYLIENWWNRLLFPSRLDLKQLDKTAFRFDFSLIIGYIVAETGILILINRLVASNSNGETLSDPLLILMGLFVPFTVWNWLSGWLTFQQHTHPRIKWFERKEDWSYFSGQIQSSVHIVFPLVIGLSFENIMEHTAHHAYTGIPLYNLLGAQKRLEAEYPSDVIVQRWTLEECLRSFSFCKLYDYQKQRWMDFSGKPSL